MKKALMASLLTYGMVMSLGVTAAVRSTYLSDIERAKMDIYQAEKVIEQADHDIAEYSKDVYKGSHYESFPAKARKERADALQLLQDAERRLENLEHEKSLEKEL